ncbi:hypothetical protein BOTBODRAFT_189772 [Botryobasidium botryosum FD-172 SS1]|uniref:F-box domain-containing protein n=1 Tax=Botryobasidium botryosum (strain FD-172 SS1) TaxID=930990 RepID=A0A067M719_BOTB1|nr:hypothetical protein BOTBODRAFT_189772 [Botryobasidium botryosum FD-172 SS1]
MDFDRELPFSPICLLEALVPFLPLPTELIITIISETPYLDGGETTRMLCLVSKHFRALAKPFYFHSVVICGENQARGLLRQLKEDSNAASTMRYLFFSERAPRYRGDSGERPSDPHIPNRPGFGPAIGVSYQIAELVSPYLESFCYFDYTAYSFGPWMPPGTVSAPSIFSLPFPRLRELTVNCRDAIYMAARFPFPSLERFHSYLDSFVSRLFEPSRLNAVFPRLTHLKVTGICLYTNHFDFMDGVGYALGVLPSMTQENEHSDSHLPWLHCIILRPTLAYARGGGALGALASVVRMASYRLMMEVPTDHDMNHWNAKADWLDRLAGGEGCWKARRILAEGKAQQS